MIDFEDITYLKTGSEIQKKTYQVLTEHSILKQLNAYDPVLAGTIPLDMAIEDSDLDIICYWEDKETFIRNLKDCFGNYPGFLLKTKTISGSDTVLARFDADGFKIEVFGQDIPVCEQAAYIHMIAEDSLLQERGKIFRQRILDLKRKGHKTEP
ncbi:DUF4269 domain-containing protein, partial [Sinomicrobium weinanense]